MPLTTEFSLAGKTALITGAGRGIGTGIAEVFSEAGATVIVNALTDKHLAPFAQALQAKSGQTVVALPGDVTTIEGVAALVARTMTVTGQIDILVNNLGDSIRRPLVELSDAEVETILALNLMSTIHCCRVVGKHMVERRQGKIVNISSFGALKGQAGNSLYAAAKAALGGLTRSLALEWVPYGISVNAVAPGIFPDPATIGVEAYAATVESAKTRIPLGRVGRLREVGLAALYLASSASDYMVGQTLPLDGGLTT